MDRHHWSRHISRLDPATDYHEIYQILAFHEFPWDMLLVELIGAAQRGSRRGVAGELSAAARHRGDYRGGREELTPRGGDLLAGLPVAIIALAALVRPAAWRYFTSGSTGAYSLTPDAWRQLTGDRRDLGASTKARSA
jgi:hypothetical protein